MVNECSVREFLTIGGGMVNGNNSEVRYVFVAYIPDCMFKAVIFGYFFLLDFDVIPNG